MLSWQAPTILNPMLASGDKDFLPAMIAIEPLVYFDDNDEPMLVLAAEFPSIEAGTLDPDGLFVIWKLREGVKWHDGEDFNAEDVQFTWEYANAESAPITFGAPWTLIESVDVIDDYTVQFNFTEPNPNWVESALGVSGVILPEHVLREFLGSAAPDAPFNLAPIGTGPYKVSEFRPGDVVLFDINEDYWDPGKPSFDSIEYKGGGDAASAARAVLTTGEGDFAWNLQIEPAVLNQLAEGGQGVIVPQPWASTERIIINFADPNTEIDGAFAEPSTEHPIWKHKEAREALNLAVQRDIIAEQLYGQGGEATGDIRTIPERFRLNTPWEYNLDKAREKLAAIDFPDAFESTALLYQTSTNSVRQKTQEIVKSDLEKLGFSVTLKSIDSAVYFASDAGNPDTSSHFYADLEEYSNGGGGPYPIRWAIRFRSDEIAEKANNWSGENINRYNNPAYDELHDQAKVELDEERQNEIWKEMLAIVQDDIVDVPIVDRKGLSAVSNRIKGVHTSAYGSTGVFDIKYWHL